MNIRYIFAAVCAASAAAMIIYYARRSNKLSSFLTGTLTGVMSLAGVSLFGDYVGVTLPLNIFNTIASAVLGVPYVLSAVLINNFHIVM